MHIPFRTSYILAAGLWGAQAQAQNLQTAPPDSTRVQALDKLALQHFAQGQLQQAQDYAQQAVQLANRINHPRGRAQAYTTLGQLYHRQRQYQNALNSYLHAARTYELERMMLPLADTYQHMAVTYQAMDVYLQAVSYLQKAQQVYRKEDRPRLAMGLQAQVAELQRQAGFLDEAYASLEQLQRQQAGLDPERQWETLAQLSELNADRGRYPEAMAQAQQLLDLYAGRKDLYQQSVALNRCGFMAKRMGAYDKAAAFFNRSVALAESGLRDRLPAPQLATFYTNIGVAYTNLRFYDKAQGFYSRAQLALRKHPDRAQLVGLYNYLASNYYLSGKNLLARRNAEAALEGVSLLAAPKTIDDELCLNPEQEGALSLKQGQVRQTPQQRQIAATAHRILALVYRQEGQDVQARRHEAEYRQLEAGLLRDQEQRRLRALQLQQEAAQDEDQLLSQVAGQQREAEALYRMGQEALKQQKDLELQQAELKLLKHQKELQQAALDNQRLEQARIEQQLALAQQQAQADQQQQAILLLQKDADLKQLELDRRRLSQEQQERQLELLKQQEQLQAAAIERQRLMTYSAAGGGVLLLLLLGLMTKTSRDRKRANLRLAEQQEEIIVQNEELMQQREEILAHRDAMEEKNQVLEQMNERIGSSMRAATLIQAAMLPPAHILQALLGEHLLLYRPKDTVSGDFYWLQRTECGQIHLVVADCTGHGVPGALLSIVGKNMLDKIVRLHQVYEPAQILEQLHEEIQQGLRQHETSANIGMDLAVLRMRSTETGMDVSFAGARRPLVYLLPGEAKLHALPGTRRSIGGRQRTDRPFEQRELHMPKGSRLYLCTDGLADQHNMERQSLRTPTIHALLEQLATAPFARQQQALEELLARHMQGTDQRDDILFMGFGV